MAKRNLKAVESQTDQEKLHDAIFEAQTYFWQIQSLTKALDLDAMNSSLELSDTDKANFAALIKTLAFQGNRAMEVVDMQVTQLEVANDQAHS